MAPEWAHEVAPLCLRVYTDWMDSSLQKADFHWKPLQWRGLSFRNPTGIAGGLDKTGENLEDWQKLGAGFLEVGTLTPLPQVGNPGKVIDRNSATQSLWNKMGFPNEGVQQFAAEYSNKDLRVPLFINIGKNRATDLQRSVEDYVYCTEILKDLADVFVLNVSSPNTEGLTSLQAAREIQTLVTAVRKITKTPVLLKLSPDLKEAELLATLEAALDAGASGFVLTNTTAQRPETSVFPKSGGVSGQALRDLSRKNLEITATYLKKQASADILIVSAGGVDSFKEVQLRLDLGAQLVQIYSALAFKGPGLFLQFARQACQ